MSDNLGGRSSTGKRVDSRARYYIQLSEAAAAWVFDSYDNTGLLNSMEVPRIRASTLFYELLLMMVMEDFCRYDHCCLGCFNVLDDDD